MTCPQCRERGCEVEVEIASVSYDNRSVTTALIARCPICGWTGGPYHL